MPRNAVNQAPKKTLRSNPEAILQGRIMAALSKVSGCTVWRNNVGTAVYEGGARVEYGVGGTGAPDLLCEVLYHGSALALWLEVKTPEGVVEEHQKRWHTAAPLEEWQTALLSVYRRLAAAALRMGLDQDDDEAAVK